MGLVKLICDVGREVQVTAGRWVIYDVSFKIARGKVTQATAINILIFCSRGNIIEHGSRLQCV